MIQLRPYQQNAVAELRKHFAAKKNRVVLCLPTGAGKCLAKDTPVLMFDGTIKPVQDVEIGDLLMGPDSTPRTVISLARGQEMMYKVTPKKGEPYTVNQNQILNLKIYQT